MNIIIVVVGILFLTLEFVVHLSWVEIGKNITYLKQEIEKMRKEIYGGKK